MADVVIKVENLSKKYTIRHQNRADDGLRHAIHNFATAPIRWLIEQRAGRNGQSDGNTRHDARSRAEGFYALKDVAFEVGRGEVVGIIGRNGAGKSTLLKILSRITEPTDGRARIRGRVASLLEVGTGFHPELTGRENIFLNGAVLGMTRQEIDRKFVHIVEFSGIGKFLDTPVKRYSSGMAVRLAFAVAAHLEPEILLVDEVLAVGDAEFQRKCLGKMKEVTRQGRTVLFVSHNMAAIRGLCPRTLLLERGRLIQDDRTERVVARYLDRNLVEGAIVSEQGIAERVQRSGESDQFFLRLKEVSLMDEDGVARTQFRSDERIRVGITYECLQPAADLRISVSLVDGDGGPILTTQNVDGGPNLRSYHLEPGVYRSSCVFPESLLGEKQFWVTVNLEIPRDERLVLEKALGFQVTFIGRDGMQYITHKETFLRPYLEWETVTLRTNPVSGEVAS